MDSIIKNAELTIEKARDKTQRNELIQEILDNQNFTGWVRSFVFRNGGQEDDVQMVINDTILNLVKSCLKPDFRINSSVEGYLKGSAKFIWYQMFRKSKSFTALENVTELSEQESVTVELINRDKKLLLAKLLDNLGEDCRKVLMLWSYNLKMKEIAAKLNYASEGYAKKRKHICLKRLIEISKKYPGIITELRSYG